MHYADLLNDTTVDYCFICNRATDHVGEHDELSSCAGPKCAECAPRLPAIKAKREAALRR